jgi:hypothetical protein
MVAIAYLLMIGFVPVFVVGIVYLIINNPELLAKLKSIFARRSSTGVSSGSDAAEQESTAPRSSR